MHQVSSAGESEKSLQRPVLMNSSAITIPTLFKTLSTSQDRNCPHMSSTISLKASDTFLIVMHQVSSAGKSEKSLQRPVLMNSSAITIPTLFKTLSTSQDRNCPHMSSTISLKASDTFLIVMHQISSAGESEKSLQRPVLINSSAITIPTLFKPLSTSQDRNCPHMSSTISLKASDSFLIVMHKVSSAGESEKSLQRPVLINSSAITIPTLFKTLSTSQDRNCPHMSSTFIKSL